MDTLNKYMDFKVKAISESKTEGVYGISPLPTGFGYTLGNVLRRTLLSSIKGAAITEVRIADVPHQFSTVEGMKEDVLRFILNLKQVRFVLHDDKPVVLKLVAKGIKDVTAADFTENASVEIANPDAHLVSLTTKSAKVDVQVLIEPGYGYVAREVLEYPKIGVLAVDSNFSPVVHVSTEVEETRVGENTDLDKLLLTIQTDGTIAPADSLQQAAELLVSYFARMSGQQVTNDRLQPVVVEGALDAANEADISVEGADIALEELDLPLRTINSLKRSGIENLAGLMELTEDALLGVRGLGETSIQQIKDLLENETWK